MSSFPQHEYNVKKLVEMGFDVDDAIDENGEVVFESWGYDEQVSLYASIIEQLDSVGFSFDSDVSDVVKKINRATQILKE